MADALISLGVDGILKKLLSIAAGELAFAREYEEKLTNLQGILDLIHAKLRDADRRKETEAVTVWLRQLKDAVGDADNVLDEVHYEMLRRQVTRRDRVARKVPCLSLPSLKKFSFRREMGHRIEEITKKLFEINKRANDLGLLDEQPVGAVLDSLSMCRETDPFLDEFKIVGRENDKLHIIQLLTQPRKEEKLVIVPIVGMGGIGKTTLAKSVYNNPEIEKHFEVRAWLCVSVKVDINTLLAKIYESLTREQCKSPTRVNLITDLREQLGSKRFLLVLDDVWDEEVSHWDDFRSCMLKVNSHNGSGILVTTRNREIGAKAMSEDMRALEGLSDDECWSIFKERAFVAGQLPLPELEEIGREIVKKCRGLPLLVNVTGGMLRNYSDKEKWLSIKDSKVWDLEEEGDRVQNSLKLSIDNLPNSVVKQCFAYCSIFEKDTCMERKELIQLWMALGLVQADETRNKEMENVGNDIFQILLSSSLFQDVTTDKYGHVYYCRMHDLVHDLSLSLSKHESLCMVASPNDIVHIPHVKHLAVNQEYNEHYKFEGQVFTVFKGDSTARTLHTLFFKGGVEKNIPFQHFKYMRILKLLGCKLKKVDDSIGDLVHLRYLDLSWTEINVLPISICKLYHLQTLKLIGCGHLKELPREITNLISIRNFVFEESISIHNVGKLTSLRTLSSFGVHKERGQQIEELGHLKHLGGHLCILNLEEISSKEDAIKADLSGKKNIYNIEFHWSRNEGANRNDEDVLEGLQPSHNVKSLTIKKFSGKKFPAWVTKMAIDIEGKWMPLHKLVDISLSGCSSCVSLPVLECLPLLQNLVLQDMDNLTCLSSSFGKGGIVSGSVKPLSPSLISLRLNGMKRLEKWIDSETNSSTMISPVLKRLSISDCPNIILLDECHSHPLVSLVIRDCKNLVSIDSIQGLTSLESLTIYKCPALLEIPNLHNQFHSLNSLYILDCHKLTSLPCEIFDCFASLIDLNLGPFSEDLHCFPPLQGIEKLQNHLGFLYLIGWPHWESIPEEIKHLTSLSMLVIEGFGMQELPMWLTNMTSIRRIWFRNCEGLDKEKIKRGAPREAREVTLNNEDCK